MDELDPGHRVQLAGALVQHQLGVRQRLEPGAEARLRLAHALRDRADPSALAGIDVEDAIRLGEPQRTEHDGLRLVRPPHAGQSRAAVGTHFLADPTSHARMTRVRIYTTRWCGFCERAKALLDLREVPYEEVAPRRRSRVPREADGHDRPVDRAADPDRRPPDRRLHGARAPRPRRPARRAARRVGRHLARGAVPRARACATTIRSIGVPQRSHGSPARP